MTPSRARHSNEILSDFYSRPAYWAELFTASLDEVEFASLGEVTSWSPQIPDQKLSPIVASQFAVRDQRYLVLRYGGVAAEGTVNIVDALGGAQLWEIAKSFYRDYFVRNATDVEIILFWQMILNSVLMDLLGSTTPQKVQEATLDRRAYVQRNLPVLTKSFERPYRSYRKLDAVSMEKGKMVIQQVQPTLPAREMALTILEDATQNWVFTIPISLNDGATVSNYAVVGPKYIAHKLQVKGRRLIGGGRSFVLARQWIQRFTTQDEFNTLLTINQVLQPVSVLLSDKPDRPYEIRPMSYEEAGCRIAEAHSVLPEINPCGFAFAIGAYDGDALAGTLTLNTPVAAVGGLEGYFYLVEVSRIAVAPGYEQKGVSSLLLDWAIENRELFNRSDHPAKLVTYSMLDEPGTIYLRHAELEPVNLVKPGKRDAGSNVAISEIWKIRWDTAAPQSEIQRHLPAIHPLYMKYSKGRDSFTGRIFSPQQRMLQNRNLRPFKTVEQVQDLGRVLGMNFRTWRSSEGRSAVWYANRELVGPFKREVLKSLNQRLALG